MKDKTYVRLAFIIIGILYTFYITVGVLSVIALVRYIWS